MFREQKSRVVIALVAGMLASLLSMTSANTAGALFVVGPQTGDEATFVQLINAERSAAGLAPLMVDSGMTAAARTWSIEMASGEFLAHAPDISTGLPAGWQGGGENVGRGGAANSLHTSFMNSPGHRANIMDPSFNVIGVGVYMNDAGTTMYTTHRFGNVPGYGGVVATPPTATPIPLPPTPLPTSTPVPPPPTPVPTSTPIVIQVPPTATFVPPTATAIPPTATTAPVIVQTPPTATATSAPIIIQTPPTATATSAPIIIQTPPTATSAPVFIPNPATSTPIPPTATSVKPTATNVPPTATPIVLREPVATARPAATATARPAATATPRPAATTRPAATATARPANPTTRPATSTPLPVATSVPTSQLDTDSRPGELAFADEAKLAIAARTGVVYDGGSREGFARSALENQFAPLVEEAAAMLRAAIIG